ncbi:MAG: D-alanyl-D-alanine carboxypeptidase/D-alanyl-D-alanine-endopeptidase [Bacteroidia bacterium]|nr:D-alanyl-D-alanine carboxypeptidase/D-alanyl-D-alanine-endopeptidase [Bacteroidia bacterium]
MKPLFVCLLFLSIYVNAQFDGLLNEWKADKDLKGASYGFCVMNAKTSEVVAEHKAHELMIPASTLKIVTTAAALKLLGPSFRYTTKLSYTGNFNKTTGVLDGDLVIVGSGDPSLQSENFGKESCVEKWAQELKKKGIKEINGSIIGDASAFEREIPGEWIWADMGNYFGSTPCGLSYMDNKFKLIYYSGSTGSEAKLQSASPEYYSKKYELNSNVISKGSEDEAYVYGDPYSYTKEIRGAIPPNKSNYEVEAALPDPALLCAEHLALALEKAGIKCNRNKASSNYKKDVLKISKDVFYTHYSPTLDKIVYFTNLKSNNLYCESLLRSLGKGSEKEGLEQVKAFCKERGLNTDEIFMVDGCGLARANTSTTGFLTSMLGKMARDSSTFKILKNSFPVAGKSGSMSYMGKGKFIEDNMHAKTGYINRARAYCGYVTSRSGKELAFSVILNNYTCTAREAKLKLEKFLVELGEL